MAGQLLGRCTLSERDQLISYLAHQSHKSMPATCCHMEADMHVNVLWARSRGEHPQVQTSNNYGHSLYQSKCRMLIGIN